MSFPILHLPFCLLFLSCVYRKGLGIEVSKTWIQTVSSFHNCAIIRNLLNFSDFSSLPSKMKITIHIHRFLLKLNDDDTFYVPRYYLGYSKCSISNIYYLLFSSLSVTSCVSQAFSFLPHTVLYETTVSHYFVFSSNDYDKDNKGEEKEEEEK